MITHTFLIFSLNICFWVYLKLSFSFFPNFLLGFNIPIFDSRGSNCFGFRWLRQKWSSFPSCLETVLSQHRLKVKNWHSGNIVWSLGYFYWQPKTYSESVTTCTIYVLCCTFIFIREWLWMCFIWVFGPWLLGPSQEGSGCGHEPLIGPREPCGRHPSFPLNIWCFKFWRSLDST